MLSAISFDIVFMVSNVFCFLTKNSQKTPVYSKALPENIIRLWTLLQVTYEYFIAILLLIAECLDDVSGYFDNILKFSLSMHSPKNICYKTFMQYIPVYILIV